jgi:hypothetical protein
MYTQKTINNERFSVRFCAVAEYLNFKKVAGFEKLLKQMQPNARISFGVSHVRVGRLLEELEDFKSWEQEGD